MLLLSRAPLQGCSPFHTTCLTHCLPQGDVESKPDVGASPSHMLSSPPSSSKRPSAQSAQSANDMTPSKYNSPAKPKKSAVAASPTKANDYEDDEAPTLQIAKDLPAELPGFDSFMCDDTGHVTVVSTD